MTTPRIEEMIEEFDKEFFHYKQDSFGGGYSDTPTAGIFCGCYEGDLDDHLKEARPKALAFIRKALTQAKQAGIDEAVGVVEKHSYYAKFGYNTTAETIAVSLPKEKRICDTDDTIKALQDKK